MSRSSWLGRKGTPVRGYNSGRWRLHAIPAVPFDCPSRIGPLTREGDLYFRNHAVGSMIHLHLAALPDFLSAFSKRAQLIQGGRRDRAD
ncbi:MAG: hypothetical protein U0800_20475 [Isosphaeraceae bacterium]